MAQSFSTIATTPISGPERSPLQNAVDSDHLDRVQSLLKRDGSIGDPEVWQTQLRRAFPLVKSKEVGELLVRHGADINSKGEDGSTLLMETTIKSVIEWLIDQKVELEVKDNKGRTALRRTVQVDDDQAKAIFLIDNTNANINASDNEGRTVLMTAVWKSRVEVMDKLLSRKDPDPEVEINQLDGKGRIALHHLASDKKRNYEYKTRPGPGEQQYIDQDILEKLSNAGNEPSAKDNKGLTCLHWAAAMGCSGLLKVFLESGKFNVDVDEENYGAWTPLHHACEAPNDVAKSVEILLNHEADPNKKTRNGRTPLHLAAAAGNLEIVRTLLKHKDIKRNARDMFGNTALLSAASLKPAHPKRTAIVKLFSPWREIHSPSRSDDVERAAKLWQATIVDFRPKKDDGHHVRGIATEAKAKDKVPESQQKVVSQEQAGGEKKLSQTSVFELLYARDSEDDDKPAQPVSPPSLGRDGFRWIHLPANNVAWCQDLLSKYYVEEGTMDVNSFKALERSFNQQRGGGEPQSRYMSPTCQPVLRPWGNEEGDITRGDSAEGGISRPGSMVQPKYKLSSDSESPENIDNERTATVMFLDPAKTVHSPKGSYDDGQPPMKSKRKDDDGYISDFYVFMPYLHFETVQSHQDMYKFGKHFTGKKVLPSSELDKPGTNEKDVALFRAHLNSPEQSLHVRRTLDQSFYHHINTEGRDRDQVIHRFQKNFTSTDDGESKILMVDQLWMWVIGQNLIVTSFSPRWAQPKKDPLDLLDYVKSIVELGSREPIRSVYELAMIISGRCYGAYDRHGVGSDDDHFLDMFEGWIGGAMNDEVEVFKFFKQDSARASDWLRNPHSLREVKRRQERLRKKLRQVETIRTTNFKVIKTPHTKYPSTDESFVENLLDIGWETTLLEEVKDIRDELGMLAMIFDRQEYVRQGIKDAIDTISVQKEWSSGAKEKFTRAFDDHKKTITQPKKDTDRMEKQAKGVYDSVRDLLDLKQKHANAIEARYAREQTDDSSRQGKTLTVFTTVTTIFLPISFIAAFFAINIGELPHDDHGAQILSLGFVSQYTFGVGLTIALLCVVLALKVEGFMCWIRDMREKEGESPAERVNKSAAKNQPNAQTAQARTRTNGQPAPQPAARATAHNLWAHVLRLRFPHRQQRKRKDEESGTSQSESNIVMGTHNGKGH